MPSFNPRSRTGSDRQRRGSAAQLCRFNPRSRTGSDECRCWQWRSCRASIHAPARGATCGHGSVKARADCFNPRSRTGSDCGPFLPLPRNDIQGIFRAGHVSRSIYAINKSSLKNYRNKIILLKKSRTSQKNAVRFWFSRAIASSSQSPLQPV